jgi:cell shape-determining protein MreC
LVAGKVLQVKDDEVMIDKGARDGLRAGMKFIVVSNPGHAESAKEGKVIKANEAFVELKVATVSKSSSAATILPAAAKSLVKPGFFIYAR